MTVLYYVSPHNLTYFERGMVDRRAFDRFRHALAPHLFADLGDLVPGPHFLPDFVHFNEDGIALASDALGRALAAGGWPEPRAVPRVPGPLARLRLNLHYTREAWRAGFFEDPS